MSHLVRYALTAAIAAILLCCLSCSGGNNPVSPESDPTPALQASTDTAPGSRVLLGAYRLLIDEFGEITVTPMRQADAHFDVTEALFPPNCYDCFYGEVLSIQGTTWTFIFFMRNPTGLTGYDVRAILLEMGDISLISVPDSYTETFADPDDPTPRNPYFIFDSETGQNEWSPMAWGIRQVSFTRPDGAKFAEIDVVIDASWPANQDEPTKISQLNLSNGLLYTDGSTYTNLTCQVSDWQDNITGVTVDLSPLGGAEEVQLGQAVDGTWFLNGIICSPSCEPGLKELWVTASSGGASVYNYANCTVENPPPPDPAIWTFLLYLHAADLPDEEDINELEMSGSIPGKLNLIVLWDKPEPTEQDVILKVQHDPNGYNLNIVSSTVDDGGAVIPPGGLDMGDGETLEKFLLWSMEKFPAQHYGLDLWDHGAGIFYDDYIPAPFRNVCGGLTLWETRDACEAALNSQTLVDKFDFIGFDVCVLGWIETAYCLKDVTDIVIASENNEPGPGWDYGPPFINLRDNIETYSAEQLAYDIVEYYMISYTDPSHPYHYPVDHCTQAASSTDILVNEVVPALNDFVEISIQYLPGLHSHFEDCRAATDYWGWDTSDIGHFATEIVNYQDLPEPVRTEAQNLLNAVESAMIHHGHNDGVPAFESGWKIWFPEDIDDAYPTYLMEYLEEGYLNFHETLWDEFLYAYAGKTPVIEGWLTIDDVQFSDDSGGNGNGIIEPDETIDVTLTIINNGPDTTTNTQGILLKDQNDGQYYDFPENFSFYPDIDPGLTQDNTTTFQIHVKSDCPPGTIAVVRADLGSDQSSSYNLPFFLPVDPSDILLFDLDSNGTSAPGIVAAIEANGYTVAVSSNDICDEPLEIYDAVFITLGMFDWDNPLYYPGQADYDAVEDYLDGDGRIYMESGELWYFYVFMGYPDFGPVFGIESSEDGDSDAGLILGESGTFLSGFSFNYAGDNAYVDHIDALPGAQLVMTNISPSYGMMVANTPGTYRTIGSSFEFGGLVDASSPNTKSELMDKILEFLGL